jgi:ELWxxDGT repeat protein
LSCAVVLLGLFWFAGTPAAAAAVASMVADLNTGRGGGPAILEDSVPGTFQALGNSLLFVAGRQLWVSDGTVAGTTAIFSCETCGVGPLLGTIGKTALVQLDGDLWATDGTVAGTLPLGVTLAQAASAFVPFLTLPGAAWFFSCPNGQECQLERTDGTPAGTVAVQTVGGFEPLELTTLVAAGNRVFFDLNGAIWTSDGTAAGTLSLGSFQGGGIFLGPIAITASPSRLFFVGGADNDPSRQIWTSDGTVKGTVALTHFSAAAFDNQEADGVLGDDFYCIVNDGTHGDQIYRSDGTAGGTGPVTAFTNGGALAGDPLEPVVLAQAGRQVVFAATDGTGPAGLWTVAPHAAQAKPLSGCAGGCPAVLIETPLVQVGSRVLFLTGDGTANLQLWSTDGTGAGTRRLLSCPNCFGTKFSPLAGRALFPWSAGSQSGLWVTDGTAAGTHLAFPTIGPFGDILPAAAAGDHSFLAFVGQLWAGGADATGFRQLTVFGDANGSSSPNGMVAYGGGILFQASSDAGTSLWELGVHGASATAPQALPVPPISLSGYAEINGLMYLVADQLWRTDGTVAGTVQVTDFAGDVTDLAAAGGKLFLAVTVPRPAGELSGLYSSDGTPAGTAPVPGFPDDCVDVGGLTAAGSRIYFHADCGDSTATFSIWVSDGTAAGTRQLTSPDLTASFDTFSPLVPAGNEVFFAVAGELWKSDGTTAGTVALFPPPQQAYEPMSAISNLVPFGNSVLFFAYTGTGMQRGLYRSDGTAAGTSLLQPVAPPQTAPTELAVDPAFTQLGGEELFVAYDAVHGTELWKTDGTPAGTVLVSDIAPGSMSSNPSSLVAAGGLVYFSAYEPVHGAELWQTDGTAAGTRLVQDIQPGVGSAAPAALTVAGGQLYFSADDGLHGAELWAYPLGATRCSPKPLALCLDGGRFTVQARWLNPDDNSAGDGHGVALTDDTGYFWFFDPANVELVLKTLDGRGVNGHFWTFYGALSDVEYEITETDTQTGAARRYVNPPGLLASVADISAFGPLGASAAGTVTLGPAGRPASARIAERSPAPAPAAAGCAAGTAALCLAGNRFAVTAAWRDGSGDSGTASVVPVSDDTGYLWFFSAANVEVMLKVLDGRAVNGRFWVFYGALSDVEYTITVTDTQTGAVRTYTNPAGTLASIADTGAF